MADVTISQLSIGTPNSNAVIPYSQGGSTLKASPLGIVAASPGCLLQVVNNIDETKRALNLNTTFSDTGLSISITPKFNTSKILVQASINGSADWNSGGGNKALYLQLRRDTAALTNRVGGTAPGSNSEATMGCYVFNYLDNPNTASNVTYRFYGCVNYGSGIGYINRDYNLDTRVFSSMLTLMEIAG